MVHRRTIEWLRVEYSDLPSKLQSPSTQPGHATTCIGVRRRLSFTEAQDRSFVNALLFFPNLLGSFFPILEWWKTTHRAYLFPRSYPALLPQLILLPRDSSFSSMSHSVENDVRPDGRCGEQRQEICSSRCPSYDVGSMIYRWGNLTIFDRARLWVYPCPVELPAVIRAGWRWISTLRLEDP